MDAEEISPDEIIAPKELDKTTPPSEHAGATESAMHGADSLFTSPPEDALPGGDTFSEPRRGRGRPKGSKNKPKDGTFSADFSDVDPPVDYAQMSEMLVVTTTSLAVMALGDEWRLRTPPPELPPSTPGEKEILTGALEKYLRSKNVQDIPPGWLLLFAVSTYALPRLFMPKTSGKLKTFIGWIFGKFKRKKTDPIIIEKVKVVPEEKPETKNEDWDEQ